MANMQELLSLVNRLQQACALTGDEPGSAHNGGNSINLWNELPQIVVVGGQSSGKSSVLEAIVGRDFLPRGTGIVTRRPLLLQLVRTTEGPERGEFLHLYGETFTSFDAMRLEIEKETERTCVNKSVSPKPIQLTVYSPQVPNLTLVDMPGLTKIPVGDQPASITQDIEDMARMYIEGDNAIILAVSPANSDLATSDAVKLASDVDPEGKRTIGVLTKLDIMDAGTDAREVLTGKTMPLNHGWIGVVNRSQADINGNKNMAQTRRKERDFFSGHKAYTDLENTGVDKLSDKLCSMLQNKIIQQIPKIRDFLHKNIADTRSQLDALGQPIEYDRAFMFKTVLEAARRFEDAYAGFVDEGEGGGNQILRTFEEKLRAEIEAIPLMESYYARDKVARTIDASDGWQKHLIAPETGYRKLVTLGIDTIKSPSLECVNAVHEILRKGIQDAIGSVDELSAFSVLRAQLESAAMESLDRLCIDTKATVATMISAEAAFIDAEFFRNIANSVSNSARNESSARAIRKKSAASSVASELVPREDEEIAANEDDAVEDDATDVCDPNDKMTLIGRTCHSYVRRVMRQQARSIPKAIVLKSVIQSKRQLIQSFYDTVGGNDDEALTMMLSEDPATMKKREKLGKQLELLSAAFDEVAAAGFA